MEYKYEENELNELETLKIQAAAIQKRINELTAPTSIASMCKRKPFGLPYLADHDSRNPAVFGDLPDSDAWKNFLSLGKLIHAKNGIFVQRGIRYARCPFYVDEVNKRIPTKVSDLTKEEVRISAEMIDEMVAIYNKYMVKLHTQVNLITASGVCHTIPVQVPIELEE